MDTIHPYKWRWPDLLCVWTSGKITPKNGDTDKFSERPDPSPGNPTIPLTSTTVLPETLPVWTPEQGTGVSFGGEEEVPVLRGSSGGANRVLLHKTNWKGNATEHPFQ